MGYRNLYKSLFGLTILAAGLVNGRSFAAWTIEPVDLSHQAGWSLRLDTDPSGVAHASYFVSGSDDRYTRRTTSGWQLQGTVVNADAFAIDHNGQQFFVSRP